MTALAFLHTAEVHIAGFERLVQSQAPGLRVHHAVAAPLLEQARRLGTDDPALRAALQQTLAEIACSSGARLLVCTCSTLGALAEQVDGDGRFRSARIDRPMAERALTLGSRVLLLAALNSTLDPTRALLQDCALHQDRPLQLHELLVETAWPFFMAGDTEAYLDCLAHALRAEAVEVDVIVLAQASMAPLAERLAGSGPPLLASPVLGVQWALAQPEVQGLLR